MTETKLKPDYWKIFGIICVVLILLFLINWGNNKIREKYDNSHLTAVKDELTLQGFNLTNHTGNLSVLLQDIQLYSFQLGQQSYQNALLKSLQETGFIQFGDVKLGVIR